MTLHRVLKERTLKSFCNTAGRGLEISPQAMGLIPKRDGYDVEIADWCSAETLRSHFSKLKAYLRNG